MKSVTCDFCGGPGNDIELDVSMRSAQLNYPEARWALKTFDICSGCLAALRQGFTIEIAKPPVKSAVT